ncbi:transposase family protein [Shewanella psychrophila]|uniref:Transposase family protein n=1 Tax=Shewanella psychrophila TaxID=225848 RepID=A0A1S6HWL7_9GAMM|nr:ISL3 family transposase [Shewanella psychrophila]AQS39808.1 transposase family protein [Shewanella psychrophila]
MFGSRSDSLNITAELLGLSDVKVNDVRTNLSAREITISVERTRKNIPCRQCGEPTKPHDMGRKLRLRHLPMFGKETIIEIIPRRGRCEHCDGGSTTTETLNWYDANRKLTKPLEHHLLFELVNSTVADVSRKADVDYHTVDALINRYIETEIDFSTIKALGVLGLDEISMKKGYRDFVTLITYRIDDKVSILGVVEGREKSNVIQFLRRIPHHLQKTISAVCCDLYDGYMNACKEVFDKTIPIIADRFHVRRLYRKSLVNLRKSELKKLKAALTAQEYSDLKPAIALLRKQKDHFTDEEKSVVEPLFSLSPKLKQGYQFSRELSGIFDSHITPEVAKEKMTKWINNVSAPELNCFNQFIKTLVSYQEQITNYFIARNTSGFVEGFNNRVKVLKRRCYGLSNTTKLFQRLLVDTMGMVRFAPGVTAF